MWTPIITTLLWSATSSVTGSLFEMRVAGTDRGELLVLLGDGEVWLSADDLARAGVRVGSGGRREIDGQTFVSTSALGPRARTSIDLLELEIELDPDPELLGSTRVSLAASAPEGMIRASDPSAFLNVAPRLVDGTNVDAFGELGLSAGGALFLARGGVDPSGRPFRTDTQLVIDDRERLIRWTVGDAIASTGALGGSAMLGGLTVGRAYDLDPYAIHTPTLELDGAVATPSTVEVWIDGARVSSAEVPAGTYRIEDIVPPAKSGDAQVVVRDAFGRERVLETGYYGTVVGLAEGESDFGYTLGFRRRDASSRSFDYGEPVLVGRHRLGLGSGVTAGGRVEAGLASASGGPSITVTSPYGQLDASLGASIHAADPAAPPAIGYAGQLAYNWRRDRIGLGVQATAMSAEYAHVSLAPTADRMLAAATLHAGASIGGVNLGLRGTFGRDRDRGLRALGAASARVAITDGLQLGVTFSGASDGDATLQVSLSAMLPGQVHASVGAESNETVAASVSRPIQGGEGLGFRGNANVGAALQHGEATVEGAASIGRAEATAAVAQGRLHGSVALGFAVVAVAGGGVHLSRPVRESFAVVEVPGAPRVRAYLDNREIGLTDASGRLLVPDLLPYYGNRLRIEDSDVALDYGLGSTEVVVAPSLRGGARVRFEARRERWLRGTIAVDGEALGSWASGTLRMMGPGSAVEGPIGIDGAIELVGLPAGAWSGEAIARNGRRCKVEVVVPEGSDPVVELGAVRCAPAEAP